MLRRQTQRPANPCRQHSPALRPSGYYLASGDYTQMKAARQPLVRLAPHYLSNIITLLLIFLENDLQHGAGLKTALHRHPHPLIADIINNTQVPLLPTLDKKTYPLPRRQLFSRLFSSFLQKTPPCSDKKHLQHRIDLPQPLMQPQDMATGQLTPAPTLIQEL